MATKYDEHYVLPRIIAITQVICYGKSVYNPCMTKYDAIEILKDWVKDEEKDDVFRRMCQVILYLNDDNIREQNKKLKKQVTSLNGLLKKQAEDIENRKMAARELKAQNHDLRMEIRELKRRKPKQ